MYLSLSLYLLVESIDFGVKIFNNPHHRVSYTIIDCFLSSIYAWEVSVAKMYQFQVAYHISAWSLTICGARERKFHETLSLITKPLGNNVKKLALEKYIFRKFVRQHPVQIYTKKYFKKIINKIRSRINGNFFAMHFNGKFRAEDKTVWADNQHTRAVKKFLSLLFPSASLTHEWES